MPGGRPCSFTDDTAVTTAEGLRPISELKVGDSALTRDEATGAFAFAPITQTFRHQDPVKVRLKLEDPATGTDEVIETTPDHLFHVPGIGFVQASTLNPGDPVSRAPSAEPLPSFSIVRLTSAQNDTSGALRVKALTLENQPFWAYNLEVQGYHTFFVGKSRAWVHNCPAGSNKVPVAEGEGGRFGDLKAREVSGDELTPHHMPQDKRHFLPRDEGGSVVMPHEEHKLTRTYGSKGAKTAEAEKDLSFRDTLTRDIRDVRNIAADKRGDRTFYNKGIQDMMKYYRETYPELLNKTPR